MKKKTILIIASDPHSVNYEIIKKSLFFLKKKLKNRYLFVGDEQELLKKLEINKNLLNFIDVKRNKNTKLYLKKCFEKAFQMLKGGEAHGIINLPLNKKFLPKKYPGFTEYISNFFNKKGQETMLLYNENFSVCPNTTHIPLK